jgi:hypothetical protein
MATTSILDECGENFKTNVIALESVPAFGQDALSKKVKEVPSSRAV